MIGHAIQVTFFMAAWVIVSAILSPLIGALIGFNFGPRSYGSGPRND